MSEAIVWLAIGVPVVLLVVSLYWLDRVRRREALFRWAAANGYRLLSFKQPILSEASSFPVSVSKAQAIFWFQVEGKAGPRSGWVRLGSAWRGLASSVAEVRWESAEPDAAPDRVGR
jgi:hypothetical protein